MANYTWIRNEIAELKARIVELEARLHEDGTPQGLDCDHRGNCVIKPEDETFEARRGCLDCNQWLQPVRTKRR